MTLPSPAPPTPDLHGANPDATPAQPQERRPFERTRRLVWRSRRRATAMSLYAREYGKALSGGSAPIENIYFATVQRSGSQWLKHLMDDERIRRHTGLAMFPQHRYEWDEFVKRFPRYTFVPGLYMSYDLYEEIDKPRRYRTLYVTRDPRNIAVSWYWAARDTHSPMGKINKYRKALRQLDFDEGLAYSIRALAGKFTDMRTWAQNADDPNVLLVRFEDLTADPERHLRRLFEHCRVDMPEAELRAVLTDYTKARMRARDLRRRQRRGQGTESHYRARGSSYREAFRDEHHALFRDVTGNLVEVLGYEPHAHG